MLLTPDFPDMKKFNGVFYELETVSKDRDSLQRKGKQLERTGYALGNCINDYRLLRNGDYYALYVR